MPKGIPKSGVNKGWFKKGIPGPWLGKKRPNMCNEKNPLWKGDDAHYVNKHHWVVRRLGRPTTCSNCDKNNLHGHSIHWASISRKCLRDIKDWVRLCVSCHKLYDLRKIKLKTNQNVHQ